MFTLVFAKAFLRDVKTYYRHGGTEERLGRVLRLLEAGKPIPPALRDHALQGKLRAYRELHVDGDWLLVYQKEGKALRVACLWLVTHRQLSMRERGI